MIETAEERIENEIKSVEKRLHSGRNAGKTYNTGVKEGLMIARAHVIDSSTTDKLSVEKLQEQLNSKVKVLTEIRANIEEHNQIYDLSVDTALLLEGIDGIAFDVLAAIGGDDE